jgi:Tol biopolymer transport system component
LGAAINTADNENHPTLSTDGHLLYFDRLPAAAGTYDMFWSRRRDKSDELGWTTAVSAGGCINTPANDSAMIFFEDDSTGITYTYFNSNRTGNPELYVTVYSPKGTCAPVLPITELNPPFAERNATIRHDGLEILLESNRPGSNSFDIWTATRASLADRWSTPVNVGTLNSLSYDGRPALSWDGTELYFFSDRGGDFDLYVAKREKMKIK